MYSLFISIFIFCEWFLVVLVLLRLNCTLLCGDVVWVVFFFCFFTCGGARCSIILNFCVFWMRDMWLWCFLWALFFFALLFGNFLLLFSSCSPCLIVFLVVRTLWPPWDPLDSRIALFFIIFYLRNSSYQSSCENLRMCIIVVTVFISIIFIIITYTALQRKQQHDRIITVTLWT